MPPRKTISGYPLLQLTYRTRRRPDSTTASRGVHYKLAHHILAHSRDASPASCAARRNRRRQRCRRQGAPRRTASVSLQCANQGRVYEPKLVSLAIHGWAGKKRKNEKTPSYLRSVQHMLGANKEMLQRNRRAH